jgi:nitrogenase subunit NifH
MFLPDDIEEILSEDTCNDDSVFSEERIRVQIKNLDSKGICNLLLSSSIFNWSNDFKKECMKELALRNDFDFIDYLNQNKIVKKNRVIKKEVLNLFSLYNWRRNK